MKLMMMCMLIYFLALCILLLLLCMFRELVEELHPLMKEALERRPEVGLIEISCFKMIFFCTRAVVMLHVHIKYSLPSEE